MSICCSITSHRSPLTYMDPSMLISIPFISAITTAGQVSNSNMSIFTRLLGVVLENSGNKEVFGKQIVPAEGKPAQRVTKTGSRARPVLAVVTVRSRAGYPNLISNKPFHATTMPRVRSQVPRVKTHGLQVQAAVRLEVEYDSMCDRRCP